LSFYTFSLALSVEFDLKSCINEEKKQFGLSFNKQESIQSALLVD